LDGQPGLELLKHRPGPHRNWLATFEREPGTYRRIGSSKSRPSNLLGMAHLSVVHSARPAGDADASEAELVRQIAGGDRESLALLYRRYHRRLVRFLSRVTRRADVIDEAVNDVFWVVWQHADRYRGEARVSTWIMGIAYRCALKALRVHGSEPDTVAHDDDGDDVASSALADPFAAHELNDWVGKGLARLSPDQRVAIELAYGGGHSLEEIAAIMDCPVSAVKSRMFHARVKLRNLLPVLAGSAAGASHRLERGDG
jgi:RNA polymerase sigma-70 factor (ECF subfamily)